MGTNAVVINDTNKVVVQDLSVTGDVEIAANLTINDGVSLTVNGDIRADNLYVGEASKLIVTGNIKCKLYAKSGSSVRVGGSLVSVSSLSISGANVLVEGDMTINKCKSVLLGCESDLEVAGNLTLGLIDDCASVSIQSNSSVSVGGNLVTKASKGRSKGGYRVLNIGNHVTLTIIGGLYIDQVADIGNSAIIRVGNDVSVIEGNLDIGDNCELVIGGRVSTDQWFSCGNNCKISLGSDFSSDYRWTAGDRTTIKARALDCRHVTFGSSGYIDISNIHAYRRLVIGDNSTIICDKLHIEDTGAIGRCLTLVAKLVKLTTSNLVIGDRAKIKVDKIDAAIDAIPYGISIGAHSTVEASVLDTECYLYLGQGSSLTSQEIDSKHIILYRDCKLNVDKIKTHKMVSFMGGYSDGGSLQTSRDCEINVTWNLDVDVCIIGPRNTINIGGTGRIDQLWTFPRSVLKATGNINIDTTCLDETRLATDGNFTTSTMKTRYSNVEIKGSMDSANVTLDGDSTLLVGGNLVTHNLLLLPRDLMRPTLGGEKFQDNERLGIVVGKGAYVTGALNLGNSEMSVGNLYSKKGLKVAMISIEGEHKIEEDRTLCQRVFDLKKRIKWKVS